MIDTRGFALIVLPTSIAWFILTRMQTDKDNGIYYFIGHITPHILHVLPLYKGIGGTVVVTSKKAKAELEKRYDIPVLCIDNADTRFRKNVDRIRPRLGLPPRGLQLGGPVRKTFQYLEKRAKVVIFYELFEFTEHTALKKPKTIFLAHGSALKDFMSMYPRRKEIVKSYDYMAGLGPAVKQGFIDNKSVDAAKLVDIGVARTDELHAIKKQKALREKIAKEVGFDPRKKIVGYFTTFWGPSSIYNTAKEILKNVDEDYVVLFQLHPQVPKKIRREYEEIIANKPNVYFAYESTYPSLTLPAILGVSDLLLGDVSSMVLEELLMDKPMIFCYDVGEHRQSDSDYKNIREVVDWSEHIDMDNADKTNKIFARALKKGINPKIWKKAKDDNFYDHNGTSVQAMAKFISSLL